jgi:prepilin-type processing-associated H-X9-DG protein
LSLLALTAAQAAREASRRATCINNIKQIALGVQNYESTFGRFPPIVSQTVTDPKSPRYSAHSLSVHARILGYLEKVPEYNGINLGPIPAASVGLVANSTIMHLTVDLFLCPSDSVAPVSGYGRCNYRFSVGPTYRFAPSRRDGESRLGPFTVHEDYGPQDFSDGLSNTVGLSERLQGDWTKGTFKLGGDYLMVPSGADNGRIRTADDAVAFCEAIGAINPHESRGGESWFLSGFHFTNYNHCLAPNSPQKDCALNHEQAGLHGRTLYQGVFNATSRHSGGVNVATMDGSARFVRAAINPKVWRALGTRAAGDLFGSDNW